MVCRAETPIWMVSGLEVNSPNNCFGIAQESRVPVSMTPIIKPREVR